MSNAATPFMGALSGITVVSFEQAIAAPFATRQLADLGARVIKIERPGGGDFARDYDTRVNGLCSHFVWTNRSKESVTLDVKHPQAARILDRLLARADVFIQNLAPGATARLGLDHASLKPRFPRLIVCDISGYGSWGPYRTKKAYDLLVQAESGFLSVTGTPDDMAKSGASIADIAAGMYAYSGVLAALLQRGRTGEGCLLDLSMLESMAEWMSFPMYYAYQGADAPPRAGASHATIYPYGPFLAGDGKIVMLGLQNEREWVKFCEGVLRQPSVATDERFNANARRNEHRAALRSLIEQTFAALTSEQVLERLDEVGIANARVNTMADLWAHPQLQARDRWREVGSAVGPLPAMMPPVAGDPAKSGLAARMDPIPTVGEHTDAILAEIGFDAREIADLHEAGAV